MVTIFKNVSDGGQQKGFSADLNDMSNMKHEFLCIS